MRCVNPVRNLMWAPTKPVKHVQLLQEHSLRLVRSWVTTGHDPGSRPSSMTAITDHYCRTHEKWRYHTDYPGSTSTSSSTRRLEASQRQAVPESLQFYSSPTSL
eukprot:1239071-Rhodomonas_salina.1